VLVEVLMNTGAARVLYPLLAVSLLSPFAQKLWAAILVSRVVLLSRIDWSSLNQLMLSDFLVVRIAFVWIMLFQHKLLAAHRLVSALARIVYRSSRALKWTCAGSALTSVVWLIFFNVAKPHVIGVIAAFLIYVAILLPREIQSETRRRRIGLAEVGITLASTCLCLVAFEIAAKLLVPDTMLRAIRLDPHSVFSLAKNTRVRIKTEEFSYTLTVSDEGLRDRHYGKKDESAYRILCVGDSFTMGRGVNLDETFSKVLERTLASRNLSKRVDVVNGGTGGYGIWQELILLEDKGLVLEPDLVILQVQPASDVHNALAQFDKVLRSYEPFYPTDTAWCRSEHTAITRLALRASRRSRAAAFLFARTASPRSPLVPYLRPRFRAWHTSFPPSERWRPWWFEMDLKEYYQEIEDAWALMEGSVIKMIKLCRQNGIALLVFSAPTAEETSPEAFSNLMHAYNLDPDLYDPTKSNRLVAEICDRHDLDFVDLLPGLREEHGRGGDLYFRKDGHWTARGHIVCAKVLCEHLMETYLRELVPASDDRTDG